MQGDVHDHLGRILEALGPQADLVLLDTAARGSGARDSGSAPLPRDLLFELIERFVPSQTPVVLPAEEASLLRPACAVRADRVE